MGNSCKTQTSTPADNEEFKTDLFGRPRRLEDQEIAQLLNIQFVMFFIIFSLIF